MIEYLPDTLHTLSLCDNVLGVGFYLVTLTSFTGIRVLRASNQFSSHSLFDLYIPHDPRSCDVPKRIPCQPVPSTLQQVRHANINITYKKFTTHVPFPPFLKLLDLSGSSLSLFFPPVSLSTNVLEHLNLSRNFINFFYGQINNLDHLKVLDLSNNMCSYVDENSFNGNKLLQTLNLSNNLLGFTNSVFGKKSNISLFRNLSKLQILNLSQNRIKYLHRNVFLGLSQLKSLDISDNGIRKWGFKMRHMKHLDDINLSGNRIRYIQQDVIDWIDEQSKKRRNISINLNGNDLQCDCYSLSLLKWMINNKQLFVGFESYSCRLVNSTPVYFDQLGQEINDLETTCFSKTALQIGISMAVICPILIAIFCIIYRFRWKIRYLYYLTQYGYNKCDNLLSDDDNFEFDAFISYANEDRNFVTTELIRHLEDQGGCKLCLHERDFEIGKPIAASIANAVNTSKKTIIILSEHFLKSDWCIFEFNMARMESLCSRNGRDVVFVILYGHIKMSNVPLEIMELMSTNTYKEYTTDQHGNILFWEKVLNAIKN